MKAFLPHVEVLKIDAALRAGAAALEAAHDANLKNGVYVKTTHLAFVDARLACDSFRVHILDRLDPVGILLGDEAAP